MSKQLLASGSQLRLPRRLLHPGIVVRLLGLALVDSFALWFVGLLITDGVWYLAAPISLITLGLNVVLFRDDLLPLRWLAPGLALMALLVVFPVLFTAYVAFTNYSNAHRLTKEQAVRVFEAETFLPDGAAAYRWTAFRSAAGEYAVWLVADDGQTLVARQGEPVEHVSANDAGVGPLDGDGIPERLAGYDRLTRVDTVRNITDLSSLEFGRPPDVYRISSLDRAGMVQQRFVYDASQDRLLDRETGQLFQPVQGTFTSADGMTLSPAFQATVGFRNFERLIGDAAIRGPVVQIFAWTIAFALITVVTQFALGLVLALTLNDPIVPRRLRKAMRAMLLLPYVIPSFLTILVWRGMLNTHVGIVNRLMENALGWAPDWMTDPWGAKGAVLLVTLWLGFPYFLLICTGALQAIPSEVLEAAQVDGASSWQRFWAITFPMLLTALGPLPLLALAFNFNNFNSVFLLTEGGPPMENALTPAGHSDLLISYAYKLAFTFGQGADYGFASVITILIYLAMIVVIFPQLRYGRVWVESARR